MVGVAGALVGVWWVWHGFILPVANTLTRPATALDYIFGLTVLPILAMPGVALAYFGIGLVRSKVLSNFKGVVGWLAFFGVVTVDILLSRFELFSMAGQIRESLCLLIGTLAFIPPYAILVNKLMVWDGSSAPGYRAIIGKGTIWIVTLELFNLGMEINRHYVDFKKNSGADDLPYSLAGFGITLAVVFIFYHGAISILGIDKPASRTPTTSSKESSSMGV